MTRDQINFVCAGTPIAMSILALAIVVIGVIAGVGGGGHAGRDEGAGAHLFQLLIVLQAPIVGGFLISSDWSRPARPLQIFVLQSLAVLAAFGAVYLFGL